MPGPNVLFFHVDNLGFGELSCYSGGPFRGLGRSGSTASRRKGSGFQLLSGVAVHPDEVGVADRPARDPVRDSQRAHRPAGWLGAGCVGADPG